MSDANDLAQALIDGTDMKSITRYDLVATYAALIRCPKGEFSWREINRAIVGRWDRSALDYIKRKAWQQLEESDE